VAPSGSIGWFFVSQAPKIDADVDLTSLRITTDGTVVFRLKAAGARRKDITATKWTLAGLTVTITGDQQDFSIKDATYYQTGDSFEITHRSDARSLWP